jgi:N-glycosylase/DNA lyase
LSSVTHQTSSWSDWRPFPAAGAFSARCLAETLDGGQAFRWNRAPDGTWLGQWDRFVCRVRREADGHLSWSAPQSLARKAPSALDRYFAVDVDWEDLRDRLPWRSDPHLARCLKAFPKLRILRQPFGETLLGFLCSATKQILQIKQMCNNLAVAFGPEIAPGFNALPDWPTLAAVPEADLRNCGLGFRARYIKATALLLAENPEQLRTIETLPYPEARERLIRLPGVGEKVADCVLLFGAGMLEAFPVDVWILRVMENRYQLHGWTNSQTAHFGRVHFGPLAGLAQQFLFAAEREESRGRRGAEIRTE